MAFLLFGGGWSRGYLGGGATKMATGVSVAFGPWMALASSGGLLLATDALVATRRFTGFERAPGSVFLLALAAAVLAAAALVGYARV
jgi:hypothetical protein